MKAIKMRFDRLPNGRFIVTVLKHIDKYNTFEEPMNFEQLPDALKHIETSINEVDVTDKLEGVTT